MYHGFAKPELPAIEGWQFGEITAFLGDDAGDAYVVAPDGTRAGIVWEIGDGEIQEILPPEPTRWGVYAIWFPEPNSSTEALQRNLRSVLPQLIAAYNRAHGVEG
ncbi:3-deoxy-8-phosphooctulonate synthase [Pseudoxanthomonas kaohsiungensis]|uniref:Uncharacterized protein n=1 Tax=Pseudoxanthomonas kaohsiungensis TaxID=283923 RepID=A0ABW3LV30_9GAMM|nr:3-deoxy-8-phosphooctulonate synthase [Pseudoxanthomonas kaohsiungensis]